MWKKLLIYALIIFLVSLGLLIVWFLWRNTAVLNFAIPEEKITQNNQNLEQELELKLVEQTLEVDGKSRKLNIIDGFKIEVFADGLQQPRFFDFDDQGNLIIADKGSGQVLIIDADSNKKVILSELNDVHSVDYYQGDLYIAEEDRITLVKELNTDGSFSSSEVIVDGLPGGRSLSVKAGHVTRTVVIGPDEKMYVSVGSSCNVCIEEDERRAAIVRYDLDGSNEEIFAKGLRNTVGFTFKNDEIWGVDMGRDRIGDDIPPEEVNIIKQGKNYGWPYCYGMGFNNPEFPDRKGYCQDETTDPIYEMQAHSAPLGIEFWPTADLLKSARPEKLSGQAIIAFHGSWNRTVPTGYKLVNLDVNDPQAKPVNFISGWLESDGSYWGRPVGVRFNENGELFISDDHAGVIYKVSYGE